MNPDWLNKKVGTSDIVTLTREEIRQMGLNETDEKELVARGPTPEARKRWDEFIQAMQSGDELWYFRSPEETWAGLAGCAGYAIVRGKEIVSEFVSMRS